MKNQNPIVQEIVVEKPKANFTIVASLEQLINTHIASIDKLTKERKAQKQMLEDSFLNDAVYQENATKAKEAIKVRSTTKTEILKQPGNVVLANKVKSMSQELKEKKAALSDYLLEYQRITQTTQLQLFDGEIVDIVQSAKVVKGFKQKK